MLLHAGELALLLQHVLPPLAERALVLRIKHADQQPKKREDGARRMHARMQTDRQAGRQGDTHLYTHTGACINICTHAMQRLNTYRGAPYFQIPKTLFFRCRRYRIRPSASGAHAHTQSACAMFVYKIQATRLHKKIAHGRGARVRTAHLELLVLQAQTHHLESRAKLISAHRTGDRSSHG